MDNLAWYIRNGGLLGVIMLSISGIGDHCLHDEIMHMVLLGIYAMGDHTHSRGDDN